MPENLKKIHIFAASPSDVASERAKLETVVDSLKPIADYLGLTFEIVDWREVVPDAGRPQQVIFDQLKPTSWDIFIGILWHRFGTPPGAADKTGKDYLSGTEEEFKTAYELWKQHGKPRVVLYRCTRALPFDVDPDQLKSVREFFKLIEDLKGDYPTLYQAFDTTESFEKLVLDNLQKLLIEYGKQSKISITPEVVQVLVPTIPNNLPRRQAFFGRAKEMETVMRALSPDDRTWGVLVDGIGGIGKSAIALEAAYLSQEKNLFDAFVFVTAKTNILEPRGIKELNPPARTLGEFLNETARVLGQPGIAKLTGDEKRRVLIDALRSMRTLLIYDNLETFSKEEQEGIADFLRELPQGCKAIITSRRRGGEGGIWLRVEKLDEAAAHGIIENQMSLDEGLANKLNRVGESRWQELFDETNGSPLALVHTLGLMRVRAALTFDNALEMLRGNPDEDLQKFIFQEARKELTANDKAALGAISFFVPSATFEAWMEVSELSRNALETVIDRLSALSLVDILVGEERYAVHPLTRTFVRDELLANENAERETGMRFARSWVNYAERYGGADINSYQTYDRLEMEWTNLDTAANWLWRKANVESSMMETKDSAQLLNNLVDGLESFLLFSGRWDEHVRWHTRIFKVTEEMKDWRNVGWEAYRIAFTYYNRGRTDEAKLWSERCADAWARSGNKREEALALRIRGLVARQRKDYEQAESLLQDALAILRDVGNERDVASIFNSLGSIARARENYDAAEQYFREALEISTKEEGKGDQAVYYGNFGELELDRKQLLEARKWLEWAIPLSKEVGRQDVLADNQYRLARVYEAEGDWDAAMQLVQEALKIYERLQHANLADAMALAERLKKNIRAEK